MDRWELYVKAQELHDDGKWALVEDAEAELARLRAENEKLRADVVYGIKYIRPRGRFACYDTGTDPGRTILTDGTESGLLDAVRRARENQS